MSGAYYNENDAYAAQWLRNLIAAGRIAPGDVDERSIVDVRADDLRGYRQCHFFAGIGVWSYALRLAGWSDELEVWTGSCPCQPFSSAGRGSGFDDERHLWPKWERLISERRPDRIFGEQVASRDGLAWLDTVCVDLENAGYAVGAVDLCAAGYGAPHIRQRLFFVAEPGGARVRGRRSGEDVGTASAGEGEGQERQRLRPDAGDARDLLGDANRQRCERQRLHVRPRGSLEDPAQAARPGPVNGFWGGAEWIVCRDGKARPIEPGIAPLADGTHARVGRLRAYGNAIVAEVAAGFIRAYRHT